jgi:hypothetical protein
MKLQIGSKMTGTGSGWSVGAIGTHFPCFPGTKVQILTLQARRLC